MTEAHDRPARPLGVVLDVLRALEWSGTRGNEDLGPSRACCPLCGARAFAAEDGHRPNCRMAAAILEVSGTPPLQTIGDLGLE